MRGIGKKATLGTVWVGMLLVLLSSIAGSVVHVSAQSRPGPTGPAQSFKWLDQSTIEADNFFNGTTTTSTYNFVDSSPSDNIHEYVAQGTQYCQAPKITVTNVGDGNGTLVTFTSSGSGNNTTCKQDAGVSITLADTGKASQGPTAGGNQQDYSKTIFTWADSKTINATNYIADTFADDGSGKFLRQGYAQGNCRDYIIIDNKSDPTKGTIHITAPSRNTCSETTQAINLQNTDASGLGSANTVQQPQITACDLSFNLVTIFSLKWIVCPIIEGATLAVGKLDDFINSQLQPDMSAFDKNGSYHVAWNSFRVIALGFVVIAALVMVISQAAGIEIMDAYTTRKVLPALLAAAIFIGLSWDILKVFYQFSADASDGIRTLIYAPFQSFGKMELGGGAAFSTILLGTGGALALGWIGLLSFIGTALLGVAVALFSLLMIHTASYAMLIISPVAIAAAILPNTRKAYTLWKDATISLLLAPVMVSAAIAAFRVAAVISYNSPGNTIIHQDVAIILYYGADFLVIWILSRVGGFAATLTGMANDRTRGAFDRLRNFRGNKMKENFTAMKEGNRFADNNPLSKTFNTTTQGLGTGWKGRFGLGKRGAEARDQSVRTAAGNVMNSAGYKAIQEDDLALKAATAGSASEARRRMTALGYKTEEINHAVAAVQSSVGFGRAQQVAAFQGLVNTGTGFANMEEQNETLGFIAEHQGRTGGDVNSTVASLAGYANFKNKQMGRHDMSPGFGNLYNAGRREAGTLPGKSTTLEEQAIEMHGGIVTNQATGQKEIKEGLYHQAWRSASPFDVMKDKTPAFKNLLGHWENQYKEAQQAYANAQNDQDRDLARKLAQDAETAFTEMEQNRMYASGDNIQALDAALGRINGGGGARAWLATDSPQTVQQARSQARIPQYQQQNSTGTNVGP